MRILSRENAPILILVAFIGVAILARLRPAGPTPEVFTEAPLDEARLVAAAEGRLLLVKATASWCGPCRRMDATTFEDERVTSWLGERAVAVHLDVDARPAEAQSLGVRSIPTTVVFDGDREIARFVGYVGPDDLLARLGAVTD